MSKVQFAQPPGGTRRKLVTIQEEAATSASHPRRRRALKPVNATDRVMVAAGIFLGSREVCMDKKGHMVVTRPKNR
jgi:hypothetical protein